MLLCQLIHSNLFQMSYLRVNSTNPSLVAFDTQRPLCKSVEFQGKKPATSVKSNKQNQNVSAFFSFFAVIFFILENIDVNFKYILQI